MLALVPLVLLAFQAAQAVPLDPAKGILSKDADARLAAVRALSGDVSPEAEKLLLGVLDDEDWEVASVAATELGALGAKKALKPLLALALEGPVRGLRRAAAGALARIDPQAAYDKLVKELGDDHGARAGEALVVLGPTLAPGQKTKELEALLAGREAGPRRFAARALLAQAGSERAARLAKSLDDADLALRAGVIEMAGELGDASLLPALAEALAATSEDFLERRLRGALRTLLLALPAEAEGLATRVEKQCAATAPARARAARLFGVLASERDGARALPAAVAEALLARGLEDGERTVRAAAAAALARIASESALDLLAAHVPRESDARARRTELALLARVRGAKHAGTRALLLADLGHVEALVRERAAVYLGVRGVPEVVEPLERALADPDWTVVTAAAVSLGKTEHEESAAALIALFARGADDWRTRASAVAGLVRLRARAGVPALITALADEEALVARTAHEFLCEIARERLEPKPALWAKWWEANQPRVRLSIPEEVLERRKQLAYVRTPEELFSGTFLGLDVLVLESRGDHIENVLGELGITHRRTSSGQVTSAGLHPMGVFAANCTGEITKDERERLRWFVRAGGALFGSCWALRETIQDLEPGLLRAADTRSEVVGEVAAYPADASGRYLEGVFANDTRPLFHLEGAHLVEVLDPEEVEVLIDSPQVGQAFGCANLAAWFALGHGVVLDSANHFEGQGFKTATLSDPEQRMAFAVDHLGLDYAKLRLLRKEKFWSKTSSAAERVKDLAVFRLITNFVWLKRLAEE
ncbi:MAG: HEAT repeat domain-containing protein [Planctomycetota bacterium]